jgi:aryl-alcohol dehydrogenase-like predicted oxidoreductase
VRLKQGGAYHRRGHHRKIACVQNQYNLVQREDDALVDSLARHRLRAVLSAGRLPLVTRDGVTRDTVRTCLLRSLFCETFNRRVEDVAAVQRLPAAPILSPSPPTRTNSGVLCDTGFEKPGSRAMTDCE